VSTEGAKTFQILRKIAAGGFGSVYLSKIVHADGFSRLAAVKLLHQKWSKNEEIAGRMRDEARLLGWLRHRNIVDVMDLTRIGGRVTVVMEYLEAVDCGYIIKHCFGTNKQPVPPRVVLEIGMGSASALDAAYNQPPYSGQKPLRVIHRDIKPSNIMVDIQGTVKVLDFGVARADFEKREAATQEMAFGSFDYMSSERVFMEPAVPTSDVYALGATCFELFTGQKFGRVKIRPEEHTAWILERMGFLGDALANVQADTREEIIALIHEMMAFEADDRPDPGAVYRRMRALARKIPKDALEDWAEDVIPGLVADLQAQTGDGDDPLVGKSLVEDPMQAASEDVTVVMSNRSKATIWVHEVSVSDDTNATDPGVVEAPDETDPKGFLIPDRAGTQPHPGQRSKPSLVGPAALFMLGLVLLSLGGLAVALALFLPVGGA
jgi:serine/threonine protein kinase